MLQSGWGQTVCLFYGGCPLLRVSIMGDSTVHDFRFSVVTMVITGQMM